MDVSSLYSNIDNKEGLKVLKDEMNKHCNRLHVPTTKAIVTLMELILTLNNFEFDDKFFTQIKGTAMGTRAAPNYANVYMGNFENKYIYESPAMKSIALYKRFIDDIFFIWTGGEQRLKELLDHLNKVHDSIKFTSEYFTKAINFLDTTVIINKNGSLKTDLYYKDVDTHSFLDKTSCHPTHTKNSIPYSQFTRIKRICSGKETFERRAKEHKTFFKANCYAEKQLEKAIEKVNKASTDTRREKDQIITPLVTEFNPRTIDFNSVINKHWNITQTTEKGRKYLKAQPSVLYRRPRNLKDELVRSKFKKVEGLTAKECNPCNRKRYENCNIVKNTQTFHSSATGKSYKILHDVNCQSDWVIYLMDCKNCHKQYVGKSKTPFRIRLNNHRSHIKKKYMSRMVTKHYTDGFTNCNCSDEGQRTETCKLDKTF